MTGEQESGKKRKIIVKGQAEGEREAKRQKEGEEERERNAVGNITAVRKIENFQR